MFNRRVRTQAEAAGDIQTHLAEFSALRSEILQRSSVNYNIFALQLTIGGVTFSFALSNPNRTAFLLILPVVTYALTSRYVANYLIIRDIGTYIRTVLEPRTSGVLHWEEWRLRMGFRVHPVSRLIPLFLVFPGTAIIALALTAPYIWVGNRLSNTWHVLLIALWLLGLSVTGFSARMIGKFASRIS